MQLNVVGKNIIRVDGLAKVTGKAIYPQDIYMDGMLYGKTLRSTVPHAYFTLNTSKAEKIDGVVKIITADDVPHNYHGVLFKDHEVFCTKKVRRIGDPLAFVVAVSEKIAARALEAIEIKYQEIPPVFDAVEAMEDNIKVHDDKSNIIYHFKMRKGNIEEGFAKSAIIAENIYNTSMVDHVFLQPEAGVAYMEDDGTVVVCAATQYPHFDQSEIAEALGLPSEKVKYINAAVGGAFGGREDITVQIHLALAAVLTGKPVKTVYSRQESFHGHSKRHPQIIKMKSGADNEGKLLALEAEIIADSGAYASWAINATRKSGIHITGPYVIPNVKVDAYAVYTNNPYTGAMRGFGATQVAIAYEQQMDVLAEKLNLSPIEIRLKNAFVNGSETANGQLLTESVPFVECINEVAKALDMA